MDQLLKIVNKLFLIGLFLLITNQVKAEAFQIDTLPFTMQGNWQVCVQKDSKTQFSCKTHQVPSNIESDFPEFNGFILYRSQFNISQPISQQALGIFIDAVRDADELYINGQKIAKTGEFKPNFRKATLYSRFYFIPNHLLKADQINSIEIKVFNHACYGGLVSSAPIIDSAEKTAYRLMKNNGSIMLYIGIFFIIFVIQIFYYFAQRSHKEHLYFALFSIGTAVHLYTFSNFPLASASNLNAVFNLNIFLFAALTILFCLFINKFFHQTLNWLMKTSIAVLAISALIQVTILPLDWVYYQVTLINIISIFILAPYYIWLFYRSIQQKIPYAKTMALVMR